MKWKSESEAKAVSFCKQAATRQEEKGWCRRWQTTLQLLMMATKGEREREGDELTCSDDEVDEVNCSGRLDRFGLCCGGRREKAAVGGGIGGKEEWEEGKREETSRRLQFLSVLFLNNPRSEFSERVDGIRATRSWTRVLEKAASRRGDAGPG